MTTNKQMAQQIVASFAELGLLVTLHKINDCLINLKKLGSTNQYFSIENQGQHFLVRVNGRMYHPFTRANEANVLAKMRFFNKTTAVLNNQPDFQICADLRKSPVHKNFSEALESLSSSQKGHLSHLVANAIINIQNSKLGSQITFPIVTMIRNAIAYQSAGIRKQFPEEFTFLCAIAYRILAMLNNRSNDEWVSSHGDLLANSVYLNEDIVEIVDWEYASNAHWANDIALLSWNIGEQKSIPLVNAYVSLCESNDRFDRHLSGSQVQLDIVLQRFLHGFLRTLWYYSPEKTTETALQIERLTHTVAMSQTLIINRPLMIEQNEEHEKQPTV